MKKLVLFICLFVTFSVFADPTTVPVVDAVPSQDGSLQAPYYQQMQQYQQARQQAQQQQAQQQQVPQVKNLSSDQQQPQLGNNIDPAQLARQVAYLQQLNLPGKINQLQQAIQDLRGLYEIQANQVQDLKNQQNKLYADLDKRLKAGGAGAATQLPAVNAATGEPQANGIAVDKDTAAYQAAFALIKSKQYSDAIDAFKGYLNKYPSGKYAANAHYWLGEVYTISGSKDQAKIEFTTVVDSYSDSAKAPDALLRLGSVAFADSQFDQAKQYWSQIVSKYPKSSAARIAQVKLDNLQKV
jgi:tol-pal system protein YbgF